MDLLTLVRTALRRWYVALPVVLLGIVLAAAVQATTPPQFQAAGSVLLEEPTFDASRLPRSIVSADRLTDELNEEAADGLAAPGTDLIAQAIDRANIELTALSADSAAAEQAVDDSLEWTRERVLELQQQEEIPQGERIQASLDSAFPVAEEQIDGTYVASASIRLADPWAGLENPLGTGERTSRMLEAVLMSDVGRGRVAEETGGMVGYTVTVAENESSILEIVTGAPDPANALSGFSAVRDQLNAELDRRQERAGLPPTWRIVVNDLAPPQSAGDISPPVDRSAIAIVAAAILLATALTVAVDSAMQRRRAASSDPDLEPPASVTGGPEPTPRGAVDRTPPGVVVVSSPEAAQSPWAGQAGKARARKARARKARAGSGPSQRS